MIETRGADKAVAAWQFNLGQAYDPNLTSSYVRAMLSSQADDIVVHLSAFRSLHTRLADVVMAEPRRAPYDLLYLKRLDVIEHEIEAAFARANGDTEGMVLHAREASRLEGEMPYSFGPPFVDLPAAELLGEMSLASGNAGETAVAFGEQLQRTRLKARPLLGLAQAERARGDVHAANSAMAKYLRVRAQSDRASAH